MKRAWAAMQSDALRSLLMHVFGLARPPRRAGLTVQRMCEGGGRRAEGGYAPSSVYVMHMMVLLD